MGFRAALVEQQFSAAISKCAVVAVALGDQLQAALVDQEQAAAGFRVAVEAPPEPAQEAAGAGQQAQEEEEQVEELVQRQHHSAEALEVPRLLMSLPAMAGQVEPFSEAMERTQKTWLSCQSIQAVAVAEALLLQATEATEVLGAIMEAEEAVAALH
jgi:hypothetical protein